MDLDEVLGVVVAVAFVGFVIFMIPLFRSRLRAASVEMAAQSSAKEALCHEALTIVVGLPLSRYEKEELVFNIDMSVDDDILKAMVRLLPGSYQRDIVGACLAVSGCKLTEVTMTTEELEDRHLELYEVLHENLLLMKHKYHRSKINAYENGEPSPDKVDDRILSAADEVGLAMQSLDDYPLLMSVIRDRGVTDVRRALEMCKVMQESSSTLALSSGVL